MQEEQIFEEETVGLGEEQEEREVIARPGREIARAFAYIFAPGGPTEVKDLSPEQKREAFISTYEEIVGTILDFIGFDQALGKMNPMNIAPGLRVAIGMATMVGGGVILRVLFGDRKKRQDSGHPGDNRDREKLAVGPNAFQGAPTAVSPNLVSGPEFTPPPPIDESEGDKLPGTKDQDKT